MMETPVNNKKNFTSCQLAKEAALKKTFFIVTLLAFVLCLLLYSHSRLSSITTAKHILRHWKQNFRFQSVLTSDYYHGNSNRSSQKPEVGFSHHSIPFLQQVDKNISAQSKDDNMASVTRAILLKLKSTSSSSSTSSLSLRNDTTSSSQQLPLEASDVANNRHDGRKYLIYLCDSSAWCGGWGDRQRGVASLYLLSLAYNRTYGIKMTSPCDLAQFYQPNIIDWSLDESTLRNRTFKTIYAVDSAPPKLDNKTNFVEDVVYVQTNMDIIPAIRKHFRNKMPKYVLQKNRPAIFREIWQRLMKPTTRLQNRLDDLLIPGRKTGSTVCAHVRIGQSKNLPNDPPRLEVSSVEVVWKFMERFKNVRKYFVATDNDEVRKSARRRFGELYVDTGGKILHIDRQRNRNEACEGFETAILDQLILTKCDILVISASNFSIRAAMLKTILRNIFMFDGSSIERYKPFRHFRHRRDVGRTSDVTSYFKITTDDKDIMVYNVDTQTET